MSFKRIKNTTLSNITSAKTGDYILASSYIDIYPQNYDLWASAIEEDTALQTLFTNGSLVVNDGVADLSATDGINYLKYPHRALSVRFDNLPTRDNEFDARTTQECLEEIDFRRLTMEPTGFRNRTDTTISFVNGTRTFTITPVSGSFSFYCKGHKYTKLTAESIQITDTEGYWYFYYNLGTLSTSQYEWDFGTNKVFIAHGYWDKDNKLLITFGDERHGLVMDWVTHQYLHRAEGIKIEQNSFKPGNFTFTGDGSLNAHCQLSLTDGFVEDEDLRFNIINSATPTNFFEQKLSTIAWLPIYYKSGVNGYFRKITATAFPVASNSPNTIFYNKNNAGTWQLTNVTNNYYTAMWIFATNNVFEPIICVMGQYEAVSYILADNLNIYATLDITGLPTIEYKVLWRLIVQSSTTYTNTPKAVLRGILDATSVILNNDRYAVLYSYNGNATLGKYCEIYPGQSTDTSPFILPEDSYVRSISLRTTANSTGVMSFYNFPNLTTPFATLTFSNQSFLKVNLTIALASDTGISMKVTSGSFNKPHGAIIIQTGLS